MNRSRNETSKKNLQTILVVDDNLDFLALQRILLELEGYKVLTSESGRDAFTLLCEIEPPSLILLDMQMGDMNGLQFLALLEEKKPEIVNQVPIVFLTGMDRVPQSKVAGFIRKPVDSKKFIEAVHSFIEMSNQELSKH